MPTTPWRTRKCNVTSIPLGKIDTQYLKAVTLIPRDLVFNAVDSSVVLGALKSFRILLNRENPLPSPGACKRNSVTANTSKTIDENFLVGWCSYREMLCDLSTVL